MSSGLLQMFVELGNLHETSNYVLYWIRVNVVHQYISTDATAAWKKSRFTLSDRSDFHMIDSLLIAVQPFSRRILTSLSGDEMLQPWICLYKCVCALAVLKKLKFINCMWTLDTMWRTCQQRYHIETEEVRDSREFEQSSRLDNDDDNIYMYIYIYIYIYICVCVCVCVCVCICLNNHKYYLSLPLNFLSIYQNISFYASLFLRPFEISPHNCIHISLFRPKYHFVNIFIWHSLVWLKVRSLKHYENLNPIWLWICFFNISLQIWYLHYLCRA